MTKRIECPSPIDSQALATVLAQARQGGFDDALSQAYAAIEAQYDAESSWPAQTALLACLDALKAVELTPVEEEAEGEKQAGEKGTDSIRTPSALEPIVEMISTVEEPAPAVVEAPETPVPALRAPAAKPVRDVKLMREIYEYARANVGAPGVDAMAAKLHRASRFVRAAYQALIEEGRLIAFGNGRSRRYRAAIKGTLLVPMPGTVAKPRGRLAAEPPKQGKVAKVASKKVTKKTAKPAAKKPAPKKTSKKAAKPVHPDAERLLNRVLRRG